MTLNKYLLVPYMLDLAKWLKLAPMSGNERSLVSYECIQQNIKRISLGPNLIMCENLQNYLSQRLWPEAFS
jgi:hypothetical protein